MSGPVLIHSATAVDVDGVVADAWLLLVDGLIVLRGEGSSWTEAVLAGTPLASADRVTRVDALGVTITPGFIDLHGHGAAGFSYEDDDEGIRAALGAHRAHGTTRSVLSLVANPLVQLRDSLGQIADLAEADPTILGVHLEGPFLAMERRGAHSPDYLKTPSLDIIDDFITEGRGFLRQMTLAPELPGAMPAIGALVAQGVVAAVGHSQATYEIALEAFGAGATVLTHAFNAMNGIGHRAPGPVVAAFETESVVLELIADGHHVHPSVLGMTFTEAPGRVALITDSMAAAGSTDGHYSLGSLNVTVSNGQAVLSGTSTIAGSTLTQDVALRVAVEAAEVGLAEAVAALTSTPARVLGLGESLGRLAVGYRADLVLLNDDWSVRDVYIDGRLLTR